RIEMNVRLGHAKVEFASLDRIDVEGRAAGRFHRAANAVRLAVLVEQAADGSAGCIVDAGHAAGADGHELLLRHGGCRGAKQCIDACGNCQAFKKSHVTLSLLTGYFPFDPARSCPVSSPISCRFTIIFAPRALTMHSPPA